MGSHEVFYGRRGTGARGKVDEEDDEVVRELEERLREARRDVASRRSKDKHGSPAERERHYLPAERRRYGSPTDRDRYGPPAERGRYGSPTERDRYDPAMERENPPTVARDRPAEDRMLYVPRASVPVSTVDEDDELIRELESRMRRVAAETKTARDKTFAAKEAAKATAGKICFIAMRA